MPIRSARDLSDTVLTLEIDEMCARDRGNCAQLLVHLAEFDHRKLYLPAGYSSMFRYCVQHCLMSEGAAYRRIRAARAARQYPCILSRIADGSLNLTTVVLLAPYLRSGNATGLLESAERKGRSAVELLIAQRFPRGDLPTIVEVVKCKELTPASVEPAGATPVVVIPEHNALMLAPSDPSNASIAIQTPSRVAPLAPERFGLQTTIDRETHDLLRRAQDLLGHQLPSGDVAGVLKRALSALVMQLEKQKFAGSDRASSRQRVAGAPARHVPLYVRKAVWERDGGRCTFRGESGHRCDERRALEFDHIEPLARGGVSTVANVRLRCPAHNQYEAERVFGSGFMENKREAARERRSEEKSGAGAKRAG